MVGIELGFILAFFDNLDSVCMAMLWHLVGFHLSFISLCNLVSGTRRLDMHQCYMGGALGAR